MSEKTNRAETRKKPSRKVISGLATVVAVGSLSPVVVVPNLKRVWGMEGQTPNTPHQPEKSTAHSAEGLHKVSFKLGEHGRVWDVAETFVDKQDVREAADNIETYLPDQENHFTQPNQVITVFENSDGEVVPNPSPEE